jgi:hypothetical protein
MRGEESAYIQFVMPEENFMEAGKKRLNGDTQRLAVIARSRSFALCLLITCMFMLILICLDDLNAAK